MTKQRRRASFANAKEQCLGKRDKSFAGRIDVNAVEICSVLNEREEYYTTSSCAGRCFLYQGKGIKSTTYLVPPSAVDDNEEKKVKEKLNETTELKDEQNVNGDSSLMVNSTGNNRFVRFRISHDPIRDPQRYFNLDTIDTDPTGGGDPIRTIGQFEHKQQLNQQRQGDEQVDNSAMTIPNDTGTGTTNNNNNGNSREDDEDATIWLRFEPFILHVACQSLEAASALMAAARPAFKNVGLTSWKKKASFFLVAIWGDEGLDMPLCTPTGQRLFTSQHAKWLQQLVNERHERNLQKIHRFVHSVRHDLPPTYIIEENQVDEEDEDVFNYENALMMNDNDKQKTKSLIPKRFDVIGDVAVLYTMPENPKQVGQAVLERNKAINICVVRVGNLKGVERAATSGGLQLIAGPHRSPLLTTHGEYGIKCVVDLEHTFFSPRMGRERLRICQQVARGEHVLVLFAGVGMDAMQIAGRTEATRVVAIELNPIAVKCARRSKDLLARNKAVKTLGAAERLEIIEGNVLDILPTLHSFDRILAPRPKLEGEAGDLGTGNEGIEFLRALLPALKKDGGECHWYDFCADHEFPSCLRTRGTIERACQEAGLKMQVIHVANAGSVAMRQLRVCVDFRLCGDA